MGSVASLFLVLGGAVFGLLGLLHAFYTFMDLRRPRRLAPRDTEVIEAMRGAVVRISRGGTDMWRAWVGFNFSHSIGVLLFALTAVVAGVQDLQPANWLFAELLSVGLLYLTLAVRYWFIVPALGVALGTSCFLIAWLAS